MRIGELAAQAGTTTRTLRYYESRGLLPARRNGNGYRAYDEADLRLLHQIRTLQEFGFDLEQTRPFVECLRAGHPHRLRRDRPGPPARGGPHRPLGR
ncbi:MerR family transcriptional regulator, partial [Kitasatospora sp. NPDC093558]|uniref:MerR family transcriptional regulator n=1 Tax=Kitasatospora sp. NPDC093558 TaxID=3155201 RepID=UPI0034153F23